MHRRLILFLLAAVPLSARAAAASVLRGRFVQERHLHGFASPLRTEGRFVLALDQGLIWQAETPFAIITIITAAGLVQSIDGIETLRLPAAGMPFLGRLYTMLSGALSGDWRAMQDDFTVTRSGDAASWRVGLTPLHPDALGMPVSAMTIAGGHFVEHVRIDRPGGDWDDLAFHDQALTAGPPDQAERTALASAGR